MKGQKMLKVFSILMILVCLFGIAASAMGVLEVNDEKQLKQTEKVDAEAQIADLEKGLASLEANRTEYEVGSAYLEENEAEYITEKDAYSFSKAAFDARAAEFAKAKEGGTLDDATVAATQAQLDTLNAQLEMKKTSLETYEAARAKVDEYEAGALMVETGITKLSEKDSVSSKLAAGMDPITAAKEALEEESIATSTEIMKKFYINISAAAIAIFAFIAAFLAISATNIPSVGKIKGGTFFGFISFIIALTAIVYSVMSDYTSNILLLSALAAEAVFTLLYIISLLRYKNTLLELIAD